MKIHLGRKFVCPYCSQTQTTKHSHVRHIQRRHPFRSVRYADENEPYTQNDEEVLSEGAKDALIARLSKKLKKKKEIINKLRSKKMLVMKMGAAIRKN